MPSWGHARGSRTHNNDRRSAARWLPLSKLKERRTTKSTRAPCTFRVLYWEGSFKDGITFQDTPYVCRECDGVVDVGKHHLDFMQTSLRMLAKEGTGTGFRPGAEEFTCLSPRMVIHFKLEGFMAYLVRKRKKVLTEGNVLALPIRVFNGNVDADVGEAGVDVVPFPSSDNSADAVTEWLQDYGHKVHNAAKKTGGQAALVVAHPGGVEANCCGCRVPYFAHKQNVKITQVVILVSSTGEFKGGLLERFENALMGSSRCIIGPIRLSLPCCRANMALCELFMAHDRGELLPMLQDINAVGEKEYSTWIRLLRSALYTLGAADLEMEEKTRWITRLKEAVAGKECPPEPQPSRQHEPGKPAQAPVTPAEAWHKLALAFQDGLLPADPALESYQSRRWRFAAEPHVLVAALDMLSQRSESSWEGLFTLLEKETAATTRGMTPDDVIQFSLAALQKHGFDRRQGHLDTIPSYMWELPCAEAVEIAKLLHGRPAGSIRDPWNWLDAGAKSKVEKQHKRKDFRLWRAGAIPGRGRLAPKKVQAKPSPPACPPPARLWAGTDVVKDRTAAQASPMEGRWRSEDAEWEAVEEEWRSQELAAELEEVEVEVEEWDVAEGPEAGWDGESWTECGRSGESSQAVSSAQDRETWWSEGASSAGEHSGQRTEHAHFPASELEASTPQSGWSQLSGKRKAADLTLLQPSKAKSRGVEQVGAAEVPAAPGNVRVIPWNNGAPLQSAKHPASAKVPPRVSLQKSPDPQKELSGPPASSGARPTPAPEAPRPPAKAASSPSPVTPSPFEALQAAGAKGPPGRRPVSGTDRPRSPPRQIEADRSRSRDSRLMGSESLGAKDVAPKEPAASWDAGPTASASAPVRPPAPTPLASQSSKAAPQRVPPRRPSQDPPEAPWRESLEPPPLQTPKVPLSPPIRESDPTKEPSQEALRSLVAKAEQVRQEELRLQTLLPGQDLRPLLNVPPPPR